MQKIIALFLVLACAISTQAQDSKWQLRADYYQPKGFISFANETVNGFHFPQNFGFSVGAERDWKRGDRSRLYQTGTIGFYNDVYFERVTTLETGLGYSFRFFKGLFAGSELGIGYNRAVSSNLISVRQDNKWVSKVDESVVTNRFSTSLGLHLGYDLGQHFPKVPVTITAGYGAFGVTPFIDGLPLFAYTNPRIGVKYRW
jgi:hypothetical protein